jgi:peptide deformylase
VAIRPILKYPAPILQQKAEPVERFDEAFQAFVQDMVDTMYDCPGAVGMAAQQIGKPYRVFVMDMAAKTTKDQLLVFVNPVILQQSRNKMVREGCLSFPEYLANVRRATKVKVEAYDQYGQHFEHEAKALEAVCIQHEIDHLDGVLMIDRIASLSTDWIRRNPRPDEASEDEADD